jgi:hypothetical protein
MASDLGRWVRDEQPEALYMGSIPIVASPSTRPACRVPHKHG